MTSADTVSSAQLRATAVAAALSVGADLRAAFRTPMDVAHKRDRRDEVTEHDRRAEQNISALLLAECPGSAVVGEEFGQSGESELLWLVDPIDGTTAFIQGLAFFSVSIAAVRNGEVVAGVVYDPVAGEMFSADDDGAYLGGEPMAPLTSGDETGANVITGFPSARDLAQARAECLEGFAALVENHHTVRRISSAALSLAYVAAGRADAVFGTGVNAWDIAAGSLIVERAGGIFRGLDLGREFAEPQAGHIAGPIYYAHRFGKYPTLEGLARHVHGIRRKSATTGGELGNGVN